VKAIVNLSSRIKIEVEETDEKETLYKAISLTQHPKKCICGNMEGFYWTSNKDNEGNIYINLKCPECEARAKLGTLKKGGYFWYGFEKYIPKQSREKVDTGG